MKKTIIIPFILGIFLISSNDSQAQQCTNYSGGKTCTAQAGTGARVWGYEYFTVTSGIPVSVSAQVIQYSSGGVGNFEVDLDNLMWTHDNINNGPSGYRYFTASENTNGSMAVFYEALNNAHSTLTLSW